jgi:DNA modification methylase
LKQEQKMTRLQIRYRATESLRSYKRNARTHSKKQIRQISESIRKFGFTNPVLITREVEIIAGHGRVEAAKLLGMDKVPTIVLEDLTPDERRAYILADNKLALNAGWDSELLAIELGELSELGLAEFTGFSTAEIDISLDAARNSDPLLEELAPEDALVPPGHHPTSRRGDVWQLGRHALICGDAREPADYDAVTSNKPIDCIFTDPPYNCPVNGHVCGLGKTKHREFAMASGEMTREEFTAFLTATLGLAAARCKDGAIAFVCMDWRGMEPLLAAGREAFTEHKQLCVWNKTNGGMGTFYRSKHELVFVFKAGTAPHTNNFGLGDTGRYRTNVWDYPGVSTLGSSREGHAHHPTPKPVVLVADALRDCTRRGELVLDPFAGSGTTLIAAETCGRAARLIEFDPLYCDVIVRRFEQFTGQKAVLTESGKTFEEMGEARGVEAGRDGL